MVFKKKMIIGSRGSDLALWQAHFVQQELQNIGIESEIKIIVTQGDAIQHLSFDKLEGKGFFTKEIEDALLRNEIDLAVHSLKDLPTTSPPGLCISALSYREDPRDLLIVRKDAHEASQPLQIRPNAIIGTSSARRKTQIKLLQPNLMIHDLRGNVPTRIDKCRKGQYDAIVIAAAGVSRLNLDLSEFNLQYLDPELFVPAPAQGVLGLQTRIDDQISIAIISKLHHPEVAEVVEIERSILNLFEGGCHMPVGVHCIKEQNQFKLLLAKAANDQQLPIKIRLVGSSADALVKQAMEKAQKPRTGTIFVSREQASWPLLYDQLIAHGYEVQFESLIDTTTTTQHADLKPSDWLFFVSRNCVKHFLSLYGVDQMKAYKVAAVGIGTATEIMKVGIQPDFIGSSSDLEEVAAQFKGMAISGSLLFPIGNRSRRTIQQLLESAFTINEQVIYETRTKTKKIEGNFAALVFTSPSNAEAFLTVNQIHSEQLLVAMGTSTASFLTKQGLSNIVIADGYREDQIAMALFSNL